MSTDSADRNAPPSEKGEKVEKVDEKIDVHQAEILTDAVDGENHEHEMGVWEAAKQYPWACFWAFIMCFTIVMESFDMFLNTNFVALQHFSKVYGVQTGEDSYAIPTRWQSALFQAGQCGAFIGVYLAGPITNRIGYRWTTLVGLVLMNATIFVSFFVRSLSLFLMHMLIGRPTRSPSLSSDKRWRASPGASSLQTRPPTPRRLSLCLFELRARQPCR